MGVSGHVLEFTAYRLVYYLYNDDVGGLTHLLAELTPEMLQSAEVTHALEVVTAATTENYHRFFKLYLKAPNMGQYLMDHLFSRIRFAALKTMAKSYVLHGLRFGETCI
jgi:SAC3 family protein LENG8/THP3